MNMSSACSNRAAQIGLGVRDQERRRDGDRDGHYARWLEQQGEDDIVPPEADR